MGVMNVDSKGRVGMAGGLLYDPGSNIKTSTWQKYYSPNNWVGTVLG